jgi:uncharacterized protein
MSYTLDANLLLYASDDSSKYHDRAHAFLQSVAGGPEIAYVFWPTIMAYLRIATHSGIFSRPLPLDSAIANVDALIRQPHVQTVAESTRFWTAFRGLAADAAPSGNLVPDAHIVSLMLEHGVRTIWTHDRDFRRFRDIDVRDPLD